MILEYRHAGAVISAIFQPPETFQKNWSSLAFSDVTCDSTHKRFLPVRLMTRSTPKQLFMTQQFRKMQRGFFIRRRAAEVLGELARQWIDLERLFEI